MCAPLLALSSAPVELLQPFLLFIPTSWTTLKEQNRSQEQAQVLDPGHCQPRSPCPCMTSAAKPFRMRLFSKATGAASKVLEKLRPGAAMPHITLPTTEVS